MTTVARILKSIRECANAKRGSTRTSGTEVGKKIGRTKDGFAAYTEQNHLIYVDSAPLSLTTLETNSLSRVPSPPPFSSRPVDQAARALRASGHP